MSKKTFKLATLGCRTNQYETQAYRDQLIGMGFSEAQEGEEATLCIVNTCTVTESADSSSRHQIRQLRKENPEAQIVVTGCLAQRRPDLIAELDSQIRIVPNDKKEELIASIFDDQQIPEFAIKEFEGHTRAFVKVQDGCNSFCTYCIIPYVRGRSRSKSIADVVREVEGLVASGYKEVVITGINVGDFDGNGEGKRLAHLLQAVDRIPGLKRLRLSSIDPDEVDQELIDVILQGKTTCRSLHIVLQAGSNVILKRMNRKYNRQIFLQTIEKLLAHDPNFSFTTDVIVGFPGETEKDFEETLEVLKEVKFSKVHMFPYSKRDRTRAALYPGQLPSATIKERKRRLLEVAEEMAFKRREAFIGKEMEILTEENGDEGSFGHTDNFLPLRIPGHLFPKNELIRVKVVANTPLELIGELL